MYVTESVTMSMSLSTFPLPSKTPLTLECSAPAIYHSIRTLQGILAPQLAAMYILMDDKLQLFKHITSFVWSYCSQTLHFGFFLFKFIGTCMFCVQESLMLRLYLLIEKCFQRDTEFQFFQNVLIDRFLELEVQWQSNGPNVMPGKVLFFFPRYKWFSSLATTTQDVSSAGNKLINLMINSTN